jgi:hypothetical protein
MEWRRVDLHLHTPGSNDYLDADATYLDLLRRAEEVGLDIVAFTDHNTVAGYAAMTQEISDLERWETSGRLRAEEKARLEEYRRLQDKVLVLPGFELTATFGFHVLAIFDPSVPVRTLEHVLLRLNVPLESLDVGATEVGPTTDVLTAYRVMAEAGALVIAAHANTNNGVAMFGFEFGGQTKIAYTQDPNLHALEVTDMESSKRRTTASFFNGSKPQYPRRMHCIQGSDSHSLRGQAGSHGFGIGERATEVLLPEVSFEALKELFLGNDFARTRPYRRSAEPFDHVTAARQLGPTIVQSFHEQMTQRAGRLHAILRDVVAFANTNGGTIYIGVSPNPKAPVKGVEDADEAMKTLRSEIQRLVTPPIEVSLSVINSGGKNILRAIVPKGTDLPYVLEGSKIFLREEGESSLAMRDEITALIKRTLGGKAHEAPRPEPQPTPRAAVQPEAAPAAEAPAPPPASDCPRVGVEITESVERKGVIYHTMRDLRDGGEVHNVSRVSARRLWRYAIALHEKHTFQEDKVTWVGDLGLWHKYLRAGRVHYDLVRREPGGQVHIYYGVTEDGIHGPWKAVVGMEE